MHLDPTTVTRPEFIRFREAAEMAMKSPETQNIAAMETTLLLLGRQFAEDGAAMQGGATKPLPTPPPLKPRPVAAGAADPAPIVTVGGADAEQLIMNSFRAQVAATKNEWLKSTASAGTGLVAAASIVAPTMLKPSVAASGLALQHVLANKEKLQSQFRHFVATSTIQSKNDPRKIISDERRGVLAMLTERMRIEARMSTVRGGNANLASSVRWYQPASDRLIISLAGKISAGTLSSKESRS